MSRHETSYSCEKNIVEGRKMKSEEKKKFLLKKQKKEKVQSCFAMQNFMQIKKKKLNSNSFK